MTMQQMVLSNKAGCAILESFLTPLTTPLTTPMATPLVTALSTPLTTLFDAPGARGLITGNSKESKEY